MLKHSNEQGDKKTWENQTGFSMEAAILLALRKVDGPNRVTLCLLRL